MVQQGLWLSLLLLHTKVQLVEAGSDWASQSQRWVRLLQTHGSPWLWQGLDTIASDFRACRKPLGHAMLLRRIDGPLDRGLLRLGSCPRILARNRVRVGFKFLI